jgi:hypothetical protein
MFCSGGLRISFHGCAEHTGAPHPLPLLCARRERPPRQQARLSIPE